VTDSPVPPSKSIVDALRAAQSDPENPWEPKPKTPRFKFGDWVCKTKGSAWHGKVVGFYRTGQTNEGYAVESFQEAGSVQIYPSSALEPWTPPAPDLDRDLMGYKLDQLEQVLAFYREAVRLFPGENGPSFIGVDPVALKQAWEYDQQILTGAKP
jgi:hypothetical protein